jgi:hypothetical protein
MRAIRKRIVTDESSRPVAVQIDYEDWLEIERSLASSPADESANISRFRGSVRLTEDPIAYQNRIRGEWS